MGEFAALIEFVPDYMDLSEKTVANASELLKSDEDYAQTKIHQADLILHLKSIFKDNPTLCVADAAAASKMTEREASVYSYALQICFPGLLSFKNIKDTYQGKRLNKLKKKSAVHFMFNNNIDHELIAKKTGWPVEKIANIDKESFLPALIEENRIVRRLKNENQIRDFFKLYPHSTAKEASKFLGICVQDVRKIAEQLRNCGEDIVFNNVTPVIEREQVAKKVLKLKKNKPSLTNYEISLELGVPVPEIRRALQNAIKVWQVEKATTYDFIFNKTNSDLEKVKEEAWDRHSASSKSSSRWLEIYLIATEKQIAMHGLKAPEKVDITQEYRLSKDQRDQVIQAAMATEVVDVEYKNVEVTGALDG